jgi:hypothetical protein
MIQIHRFGRVMIRGFPQEIDKIGIILCHFYREEPFLQRLRDMINKCFLGANTCNVLSRASYGRRDGRGRFSSMFGPLEALCVGLAMNACGRYGSGSGQQLEAHPVTDVTHLT